MTRYQALQQFLLPYFHQDWDIEFSHWRVAVAKAAEEHPNELLRRALRDVEQLLSSDCSPAILRRVILGLQVNYDPGEDSVITWLEQVQQIVRKHVTGP